MTGVMITVLITASGGVIGEGIYKCLRLAEQNEKCREKEILKFDILTADSNPAAVGLYRSTRGFVIPPARDEGYVDTIIKIAKENDVNCIFVGSDVELITLASAKDRIEKESSAKVLVNNQAIVSVARDKWSTYEFLRDGGFGCPVSTLPGARERFINEYGFPIMVKPREGWGSGNLFVCHSKYEVEYAIGRIMNHNQNPMLQQFISSQEPEFTTGVTIDKSGSHVMSSITMRRELKSGQTYRAFMEEDYEDVREQGEKIALALGIRGAVNIQSKGRYKDIKTFEINARFSATCAMRAFAGVNEPNLVLRNVIFNEQYKQIVAAKRLLCLRYWNEMYVPMVRYEQVKKDGMINNNEDTGMIPNYLSLGSASKGLGI